MSVFTTYRCDIKFRDKLMGGTPKDPKIIEGWLRSKAGISDAEELRQSMLRTLLELGAEVSSEMSYEELVKASDHLAASRQTNGFKRDESGLFVDSRTLKALLKEVTNILYAGDRWGKTKKGPRAFLAERVFPVEDRIYLGRNEPDGVDLFIGHVTGPQGPRSNLTYYEYVTGAAVSFHLKVLRASDDIDTAWPEIWELAGENGWGALRSQGFGRFDVVDFEPVATAA